MLQTDHNTTFMMRDCGLARDKEEGCHNGIKDTKDIRIPYVKCVCYGDLCNQGNINFSIHMYIFVAIFLFFTNVNYILVLSK